MKRFKILLLVIFSSIFLVGCSRTQNIEYITTKDLENFIKEEETFVLNLTSANCSACIQLEPRLVKFLNDYDVKIKRIDTAKFKDEEIKELADLTNYHATPTFIFYTDGQQESIATRIVGAVSTDKLIEDFKTMGYIK